MSPVPCRHQSCPTSNVSVSVISPPASRNSSARRRLFADSSPPVPLSLPTSSTSKMSVDSSQSFQSQDDDVPKTFCLSCNHQFASSATYNKHLPCRYEVNEEKLAKNSTALKLCPPLDRENIPQILQHLADSDFVDLCISQNWCCKDVWPLVFPGPERSGAGILGQYTANKRSYNILKGYLSVRNVITIPRCILIEDSKHGIKSLLTGQLLLPPSNAFHSISTLDSYIVTISQPGGGGQDEGEPGEGHEGVTGVVDQDGDGGGDDSSDDGSSSVVSDEDSDKSEDSDDDDVITHSLQPQQQPFATLGTFQDIRHLLPYAGPGAFYPGEDGEGAINIQQAQINRFRFPWKFQSSDLENLCNMTKAQFWDFVSMVQGAQTRSHQLNIFAESLLFLMKMAKNPSFEELTSCFALQNSTQASRIFRRIMIFYFKNCTNLPAIYDSSGNLNAAEKRRLYEMCYADTQSQPYFQTLIDALEDPHPNHHRLRGAAMCFDASYIGGQKSQDVDHQKSSFYAPRAGNVTKFLTLTTLKGKFVAAIPLGESSSPSCGDGNLTATFNSLSPYLRDILSGDDVFFVVVITDAGFVWVSRNMPLVVRNLPQLPDICADPAVNALLLHTSDDHQEYHFERTPSGKLRKIPRTDPQLLTLSENCVNLTRKLRKANEQAHAGVKQKNKILQAYKLPNSYLLPFTDSQRIKFGLDQTFANVPKLSYIVICALSLYNRYHPGYAITFMDPAEQVIAARQCLDRLFVENPLLHDIWGFPFTGVASRHWTEVRIGDLAGPGSNVLNFPQLHPDLINPVAVELTGGLNALTTSDQVLTYKQQLELKGRNLTRDQALAELENLSDDIKVSWKHIDSQPPGWDTSLFGAFVPVKLVRFAAPPTYKSAAPANFRWPVIAFADAPSDTLGLRDPYRVILYWNCFNCPSKCGLLGFCRHLAAELKLLSFPDQYRSTARGFDLLNTMADNSRQVLRALPSADVSAAIPQNIPYRSQNTRTFVSGVLNPLYDTRIPNPSPMPPVRTRVTRAPSAPVTTRPASTAAASITTTGVSPGLSSASTPTTSSSTPSSGAGPSSSVVNVGHLGGKNPILSLCHMHINIFSGPRNLVSDPQLMAHLTAIPTQNLQPLPNQSLIRPPQNANQFAIYHLQSMGLLNLQNSCCLNSLTFACNRMSLTNFLPSNAQMVQQNNHISLCFSEILRALPSAVPFSIEISIRVWNFNRPGQPITPNEDIYGLSDLFFESLLLPQRPNGDPVITEFLASYNCAICGFQDQNLTHWIGMAHLKLPGLDVPRSANPIPVGDLLTTLIQTPFNVQCGMCGNNAAVGRYNVRKGVFTVLRLNRLNMGNWRNQVLTRLNNTRTPGIGDQFLGTLISVVSHQGNPQGGHYIAYSQVNNHWHLNSDANHARQVGYHPFNSPNPNETPGLLIYYNN